MQTPRRSQTPVELIRHAVHSRAPIDAANRADSIPKASPQRLQSGSGASACRRTRSTQSSQTRTGLKPSIGAPQIRQSEGSATCSRSETAVRNPPVQLRSTRVTARQRLAGLTSVPVAWPGGPPLPSRISLLRSLKTHLTRGTAVSLSPGSKPVPFARSIILPRCAGNATALPLPRHSHPRRFTRAILNAGMPAAATTPALARRERTHSRSRGGMLLSDYLILSKPRVSLMVLLTAAGGFYLGSLASGISPFHIGLVKALARHRARHRWLLRAQPGSRAQPRHPHAAHRATPHGATPHRPSAWSGHRFRAHRWRLSLPRAYDQPHHRHAHLAHRGRLRRHLHAAQAPYAPQHLHRRLSRRAPAAHRLDRRPRHDRVARHRALRHPLRLAVPPLHGHRLALSPRLRQRRHPPHRHRQGHCPGRSLVRHPGSLLGRADDPRKPLAHMAPPHRAGLTPSPRSSSTPSTSGPRSASPRSRATPVLQKTAPSRAASSRPP